MAETILPSGVSPEKVQREAANFSSKISRFVRHIFRALAIAFSWTPLGATAWEANHWTHWRGYTHKAPTLSKEVTENETFRSALAEYQQKYNVAEKQALSALRGNFRKGSCHGSCLAFIDWIEKNPGQELEKVQLDADKIALFQSLEFFRGKLNQNANIGFRSATEIEQFSLDKHQDTTAILTGKLAQSNILLLRSWNNSKAHSFLLYASQEHNHFYFLNSQHKGLFRFDSTDDLSKGFTSHLKAQTFFAREGITWQLENY